MTTAPQNDTHDTTPVESGNPDTTPPQAETKGTTTDTPREQVDIDKIVTTRLARERKKWEAEAEEAAKRARMDEAERLKADIADRDKRIADAEAKVLQAERRAELTGKVVDPQAALRLWEDDDTLETFLARHPYMAPTATGPTPTRGAGGGTPRDGNLKPEDFKGKTPTWIAANIDRLKPPS